VSQSVDLFPLVLAHTGIPVPERMDGALWGRQDGEARAWAYIHPGAARIWPQRFEREMRSIERGGLKLIASSLGPMELYDIGADPAEARDLAKTSLALGSALLEALRAPERRAPRPAPSEQDDGETMRKLRSLGYVQ
jgi:arylsulfatase A-like enzyme